MRETGTVGVATATALLTQEDQLKELPQPQLRVALGLLMWNPAP
jgi:hypothetical protein